MALINELAVCGRLETPVIETVEIRRGTVSTDSTIDTSVARRGDASAGGIRYAPAG